MPDHPPSLSASTVALQLGLVLALVVINGIFVASEFALVSVRRTRIDQLAAEGSASATHVQRALRDINRFIAATQIGVTVASLVLGSTGEKILEVLFEHAFTTVGLPPLVVGISRVAISVGFAYFVMTTMHVVIGELIPKAVALQKSETVALLLVRPMRLFSTLVTPLIWLLHGLSGALLRLMGISANEGHEPVHSAEELDLLFTQSHEGGQLSTTEREILHRVVKFSDLTAREVMVPRVEIQGVPVEMTHRELKALLHDNPHTRTPVYHESLDEVVGIAHLKDLVRLAARLDNENCDADRKINLLATVREAARVPETVTIERLLGEFKRRREQMAIVIDEYGGTAGLVTMGDLLQQVFGEVHDEFDVHEPEIAERADGRIRLAGRVSISDVNERYGIGFRDDEADTIAGLILGVLGRPANVGDEVEINRASLRVEAVERLRITSVSLLLPADASEQTEN